jgi:HEAT repeat protein
MRVQAFLSLGKQGNPQIRTKLEPLVAKFHPQKHQAELLAIGFAIAALGDKALGESIIRKHFVLPPIPVNYRRWDLLRPGVYAIGQLRMKEFRGQIEDLSARADPFVRREAVKALSSLRDKAAIPAITARLDDTIPGVRTAAVKGLQTLTGLYNNRTPAQWRRWWANEVARGTQGLNQTTQSRNTSRKIELRKDSAASPRKHPDHPLNK